MSTYKSRFLTLVPILFEVCFQCFDLLITSEGSDLQKSLIFKCPKDVSCKMHLWVTSPSFANLEDEFSKMSKSDAPPLPRITWRDCTGLVLRCRRSRLPWACTAFGPASISVRGSGLRTSMWRPLLWWAGDFASAASLSFVDLK